MVESVDDLKSSRSMKGTLGPYFELLDARIASALNRIIHNTRFKKNVSLEEMKAQKEDRFFRGRQIAYQIYEYFRVIGANDSVENYADLLTVVLRNDDIQEFDARWDEILWSMTQIPSDDILESLFKLRIRASEKLKTVLELYNMEIRQKRAGPYYHRLKTMVKRSIDRIHEWRSLKPETEIMRQTPWSRFREQKKREQRTLGDCWQCTANGQCSKGDNCSVRHDKDKRAKSTQPNLSPRSSRQQNVRNAWRENQKSWRQKPKWKTVSTAVQGVPQSNLHQFNLWKVASSRMLVLQVNGCRFGEKCSYAHRQVDEQPDRSSKKNGDKSAVAMLKITRQLGCVYQDMEPPKSSSILRKSSNIRKPIRCVQ